MFSWIQANGTVVAALMPERQEWCPFFIFILLATGLTFHRLTTFKIGCQDDLKTKCQLRSSGCQQSQPLPTIRHKQWIWMHTVSVDNNLWVDAFRYNRLTWVSDLKELCVRCITFYDKLLTESLKCLKDGSQYSYLTQDKFINISHVPICYWGMIKLHLLIYGYKIIFI